MVCGLGGELAKTWCISDPCEPPRCSQVFPLRHSHLSLYSAITRIYNWSVISSRLVWKQESTGLGGESQGTYLWITTYLASSTNGWNLCAKQHTPFPCYVSIRYVCAVHDVPHFRLGEVGQGIITQAVCHLGRTTQTFHLLVFARFIPLLQP